jgi:hypothetical protein
MVQSPCVEKKNSVIMLNIAERKWFKINSQIFSKNDKRNLLFVNIRPHEHEKKIKLLNRIFQLIEKINFS